MVEADGFYHLRLLSRPSDPDSPHVMASLRARCLVKDKFEVTRKRGKRYIDIEGKYIGFDMSDM